MSKAKKEWKELFLTIRDDIMLKWYMFILFFKYIPYNKIMFKIKQVFKPTKRFCIYAKYFYTKNGHTRVRFKKTNCNNLVQFIYNLKETKNKKYDLVNIWYGLENEYSFYVRYNEFKTNEVFSYRFDFIPSNFNFDWKEEIKTWDKDIDKYFEKYKNKRGRSK